MFFLSIDIVLTLQQNVSNGGVVGSGCGGCGGCGGHGVGGVGGVGSIFNENILYFVLAISRSNFAQIQ